MCCVCGCGRALGGRVETRGEGQCRLTRRGTWAALGRGTPPRWRPCGGGGAWRGGRCLAAPCPPRAPGEALVGVRREARARALGGEALGGWCCLCGGARGRPSRRCPSRRQCARACQRHQEQGAPGRPSPLCRPQGVWLLSGAEGGARGHVTLVPGRLFLDRGCAPLAVLCRVSCVCGPALLRGDETEEGAALHHTLALLRLAPAPCDLSCVACARSGTWGGFLSVVVWHQL